MRRSALLGSALFIFSASAVVLFGAAHVVLADSPQKTLKPGTELHTTLVLGINSGRVKPGTKVTATVMQDVRVDGVVTIPHDSKLIGQVTLASRYRPETAAGPGANAQLGFLFDRAQLGAGREVALKAIVVALAPTASPGGTLQRYGGIIGVPGMSTTAGGVRMPQKSPGAAGGLDSSGVLKSGSLGVFDLEGLDVQANGVIVSTRTEVSLDTGTQMLLLTIGEGADESRE
jgi:hypothetical protein